MFRAKVQFLVDRGLSFVYLACTVDGAASVPLVHALSTGRTTKVPEIAQRGGSGAHEQPDVGAATGCLPGDAELQETSNREAEKDDAAAVCRLETLRTATLHEVEAFSTMRRHEHRRYPMRPISAPTPYVARNIRDKSHSGHGIRM